MSSSRAGLDDEFPLRLAAWLGAHHELICALVALRRLGPDGGQAVGAVMDVRPVAVMRLSFELWCCVVEERGSDPDALLSTRLPDEVIVELRLALGCPLRPIRSVRSLVAVHQ